MIELRPLVNRRSKGRSGSTASIFCLDGHFWGSRQVEVAARWETAGDGRFTQGLEKCLKHSASSPRISGRGGREAEVRESSGEVKDQQAAHPAPPGLQFEMLPRVALWFCSRRCCAEHTTTPSLAITPRRAGGGGSKRKKAKGRD